MQHQPGFHNTFDSGKQPGCSKVCTFIRAESEGVALLQSGFPIIHNGERIQYGSLYHSFLVSATTADDSKTGYPILLGQEAINKV